MDYDGNNILRLLIVHFLVTALVYRKLFNIGNYKKIYKSKWIYISSVIYSVVIFCVNSSWGDFWIIPGYFVAFFFISIFCYQIKHLSIRLIIFQGVLLLLLFSFWSYFSNFRFISTLPGLAALWNSRNILLVIFGFIIVIWPIGYIVGQITEPFRKQIGDEEVTKGLEKAGMWIGCIERTIIYIFVLSNFLTAIAFLVTAKSIFRFGEIRKSGSRKEAEYILIGTLLSYSIAMIVGFLVKYFLK
jgi:hypothetical protein